MEWASISTATIGLVCIFFLSFFFLFFCACLVRERRIVVLLTIPGWEDFYSFVVAGQRLRGMEAFKALHRRLPFKAPSCDGILVPKLTFSEEVFGLSRFQLDGFSPWMRPRLGRFDALRGRSLARKWFVLGFRMLKIRISSLMALDEISNRSMNFSVGKE